VTNWPGSAAASAGGVPGGMGPNSGPQQPQSKMSKALGAAGNALGTLSAGVSGFELGYNVIGPVINEGINALVSAVSGRDNSLGGMLYDLIHREKEPVKLDPIKVHISVQNGNITAQVQEETKRQGRRN